MLDIKVLGPGCVNCERLFRTVVAALEDLEARLGDDCPEVTLQHVTDYAEFMKYKLLFTPGLVINEKLVSAGRVPSKAEVMAWITKAVAEAQAG